MRKRRSQTCAKLKILVLSSLLSFLSNSAFSAEITQYPKQCFRHFASGTIVRVSGFKGSPRNVVPYTEVTASPVVMVLKNEYTSGNSTAFVLNDPRILVTVGHVGVWDPREIGRQTDQSGCIFYRNIQFLPLPFVDPKAKKTDHFKAHIVTVGTIHVESEAHLQYIIAVIPDDAANRLKIKPLVGIDESGPIP